MKRTLFCMILAALAAPGMAQSYLTTPSSGTGVDGNDSSFIFGWAAKQKHRLMDAVHANGTKRPIKALQFRADYRDHTAIGRTWSSVTIHAGHADYSSISINKSAAYKGLDTPAKVFDAKWSFPTLSGKPLLNPASWGGVKSSLNFSFSKPFAYNGKDAIFVEFNFDGGIAQNGAKWAELGDTPKGFEYFLDTMSQADWGGTGKGTSMSLPAKPTACYDSAFSSSKKGQVYPYMDLKDGSTVYLSIYTYNTAPKGNVVYAVGLGGNATGVHLGARCNRFHVDPSNGMAFFSQADKSGKGFTSLTFKAAKASWMKEFWAQAAWEDSKTRAFKMTHAVGTKFAGSGKAVPAATSYQAGGKINVWTQTKGLPYMRWIY